MWKVTLDGDKLVFTPFFDEEPKKVSVSTLYGEMVMDKVRDKFWSYNEIGKKDDEIRDLKLENDRLQQRDTLMYNFIKSVAVSRYEWVSVQADEILRRLEDLG